MTESRQELIRKVLENWGQLNVYRDRLTYEEIVIALSYEKKNHKRESHMISLHQRLCTLRKRRERKEIMEIVKDANRDR